MNRPAGITIIGVLSFAAGIIYLLQGIRVLGWVAFGPGQAFTNVSLTGWTTLIIGLFWIAVGGAFLSLQPWAWLFGVIVVGPLVDRGLLRQHQRLAVRRHVHRDDHPAGHPGLPVHRQGEGGLRHHRLNRT